MIKEMIVGLIRKPVVLMALGISITCTGCTEKDTVNVTKASDTSVEDKGWTFETTPVWQDEFDVNGAPNSQKWGYDVGGGGFGNNEKQFYTNGANANINNGILTIEARKELYQGSDYTSARLITKGTGDFLYGRFEAKMKLPSGRGTWPAFWMLPTDYEYGNWPKSGEIDIMEHVGYDPNKIHQSVHTNAYNHKIGTQKSANTVINTAMSDYHVYRVDWTPYAIRGYIDDVKIFEFVNNNSGSAAWPFDKRFHLLLNLAVGGDWGGANGIDPSIFPAKLLVDYVRVYKMIPKN
jgi:beta-glucanase (GH16 family)